MDDKNSKYSSYYFLNNKKKNNAKDFLTSIEKKILAKTIKEMKLLEIYGIDLDHCNIKKFQNGIWKIRTKDANNNVRLFFYIINDKIYYLFGFYKKSQKTPEGKKKTINNLKVSLLNNINDIEQYSQKVDFKELDKII